MRRAERQAECIIDMVDINEGDEERIIDLALYYFCMYTDCNRLPDSL